MKLSKTGPFETITATPEDGERFPIVTVSDIVKIQPTEIVCEFDYLHTGDGLGLQRTTVHGQRLYKNGRHQYGDRQWVYLGNRAPKELHEVIKKMRYPTTYGTDIKVEVLV